MDPALQRQLLVELLDCVERGTSDMGECDTLAPVSIYTSPERLSAELRVLFRQLPLVLAHASELPEPGDFITHDLSGIPLLVVRQADGSARAFLNVCRHRGTRLVEEARGHSKNFICRYHAWSYNQNGSLRSVPRRECFPSLKDDETGLVAVPLAERCGLLWGVPGGRGTELDIEAYLGPLGPELASWGLAQHHVHRQVIHRRRANWKLMMEAFLEGYHVRSLHRSTISRFFLESLLLHSFPPHSRSIGARKTLLEARAKPQEEWELRAMTTPFYSLFPNTIMVLHPDWISLVTIYPDGIDHLKYCHRMLIAQRPASEAESEHWNKTFDLIEGNVFQREDLEIAEAIQAGLSAGADSHFRLGRIEVPIQWFHEQIEKYLSALA